MAERGTAVGVDKLMPAVLEAYEVWNRRIPTPLLNRWVAEAQSRNPPPLVAGRRLRLRYMTQANIRPPTFALSPPRHSQARDLRVLAAMSTSGQTI